MATKTMKRSSSATTLEEKKVVEKKEEKQINKYAKDDYISCRSVTIGTLIMEGVKSKEAYRWTGYGDITEVQYQDLTGLVNLKSPYIYDPYFIVEDDDFIEQFPKLQKFYDEQFTTSDLEEILNLDNRSMIANIENLPKGALSTLKTLAANKVFSGEIDSVSKIRALDDCFGTELNLLSSLLD